MSKYNAKEIWDDEAKTKADFQKVCSLYSSTGKLVLKEEIVAFFDAVLTALNTKLPTSKSNPIDYNTGIVDCSKVFDDFRTQLETIETTELKNIEQDKIKTIQDRITQIQNQLKDN